MKRTLRILFGGLFLSTSFLFGCEEKTEVAPTIANIAVSHSGFQLLEDAAIRGELAGVLSNKNSNDPEGKGNYTVFAPNDAAFARLGLASAVDLLNLQKLFLTNTLLYHVANGTVPGDALQAGFTSASALGPERRIISRGGVLYVNGSRILVTNVPAANGTIHVIDKVLLATGGNVVESALALQSSAVFTKPELTFLVEAVLYCNLAGALSTTPNLTVFAPTDQAFKNLGTDLGVALNVPADIRKLPQATVTAVLLNHVITGGGKFTPELPENTTVASLGGAPVQLGAFTNGTLTVQGTNNTTPATMVIPDVQATNGVIHVIDRVLRP